MNCLLNEHIEYVPVAAEPYHVHQWGNDYVRVYHAKIPAQGVSQFHQHVQNTVYICLEPLRAKEDLIYPKSSITELKLNYGDLLFRDHRKDNLIHQITVLDPSSESFLVGIEFHHKRGLTPSGPIDDHVQLLKFSTDTSIVKVTEHFRCFRIFLENEGGDVSIDIKSNGRILIVAIHEIGNIKISKASQNGQLDHTEKLSLQKGSDYWFEAQVDTKVSIEYPSVSNGSSNLEKLREIILFEVK